MGQFNTNEHVIIDDVEPPLIRRGEPSGSPQPHHQDRCLPGAQYPLEDRIEQFRKRHFPDATDTMWNDWHWQLFHRITTYQDLCRYLEPTEDEKLALSQASTLFPFSVTPYYLSLIDPSDTQAPLRKCVIPSILEADKTSGESDDPLSEEHTTKVRGWFTGILTGFFSSPPVSAARTVVIAPVPAWSEDIRRICSSIGRKLFPISKSTPR